MGLHSFTDLSDNTQYIYTNFSPDCCHWFFPVFDQPDIRAKWRLNVAVPGDWVAIANDYEQEIDRKEKEFE